MTKHLISLGPEAFEEFTAILTSKVAPSATTQPTAQSTFFRADKNAEAIKASLFARGVARTDPSGGGVAFTTPAAPRPSSGPTPVTRTAIPPGAVRGATQAAVHPHGSPVLAPCVHEHTVDGYPLSIYRSRAR